MPKFKMQKGSGGLRNLSLKKNPFFEIQDILLEAEIRTTSKEHVKMSFKFVLIPDQIYKLYNPENYQVHLGFCKLDSIQEQPNYLPSSLQVTINNKVVDSVLNESFEPGNISRACHLNHNKSNNITVQTDEACRMFIFFVKRLDYETLIQRLLEVPPLDPELTSKKIQEELRHDESFEILPTTLLCSLLCPLSQTRLTLPCRSSTCKHLQCFDAAAYIHMNEMQPKWLCPICWNSAEYKNLQIDGYFIKILKDTTSDERVVLLADGSWKPVSVGVQDLEQVSEGLEKRGTYEDADVILLEETEVNPAKDSEYIIKDFTKARDNCTSKTIVTITLSDSEASDVEGVQATKSESFVCISEIHLQSKTLDKHWEDIGKVQSACSKSSSSSSLHTMRSSMSLGSMALQTPIKKSIPVVESRQSKKRRRTKRKKTKNKRDRKVF